MFRQAVALLLLTAALMAGPAAAVGQELDPHALYEKRCARCHDKHGGDFAAKSLEIRDGVIVGIKSGQELAAFLARGHGRTTDAEQAALVAHLSAIAGSGQLFVRKCRICHDRAVDLARSELVLKDGVLTGRYSGRNIPDFLRHHGRLSGDEVDTMTRTLERQLLAEHVLTTQP